MRHIISLLMENEPGALSRVIGLFSQRNYNIESLTVAATEDPTLSRLTLTTIGKEEVIEQITKNLNKLIEVVKLVDLTESAHVERELMLVKIKASGAQRAEVKRTADIFRGQIVDVTPVFIPCNSPEQRINSTALFRLWGLPPLLRWYAAV